MQTFAPSSASASTIALPIPVLPPVTMADFPFKLMVSLPRFPFSNITTSREIRPSRSGRRRSSREDERQQTHGERDHGRPYEQRGQRRAGVLQLAAADRRDPVSDLVERDNPARNRGRDPRELLLSEADRERQ